MNWGAADLLLCCYPHDSTHIVRQETAALRDVTSENAIHRARGLFRTLGFIRTIVRPTSIRSSRNSSQLPYFSPDRTEWAELMLFCGKSVRIGAVWSVDRFLEPNGKILVEVRLLRPILAM